MSAGGRRVICTPWVDPAAMRAGGPGHAVAEAPDLAATTGARDHDRIPGCRGRGDDRDIAAAAGTVVPGWPHSSALAHGAGRIPVSCRIAASSPRRIGDGHRIIAPDGNIEVKKASASSLGPDQGPAAEPCRPPPPPRGQGFGGFFHLSGLSGNITGRIRGCRFPYRPTGRNGLGRSATGSGGWRRDSPRFPDPRSPRRRAARHRNGGERPRADGPG